MEAVVEGITGVNVLSLHHDISTETGEEVVLFTPAGPPESSRRQERVMWPHGPASWAPRSRGKGDRSSRAYLATRFGPTHLCRLANRFLHPEALFGCRCIRFVELFEVLFVFPRRGEGFDCRPP
jgi:hypothetical protein